MIIHRSHFLGCPLDLANMQTVLEIARTTMRNKRRIYQVTLNVSSLIEMRRNEKFADYVLDSDLITADGMGIVWGARLLGIPVPERVAGIDVMYEALALCEHEGYRPYFLGAKPEVLKMALDEAQRKWPELQIAGSHHGYFQECDQGEIVAEIEHSQADCLFIGITSPIKEQFCHRWKDTLNTSFILGVGGSFDVLAGQTPRAPELMQKLGAEWAFRLWKEPSRLWRRYLSTNSCFAAAVLSALAFRRSNAEIKERTLFEHEEKP